MLTDHPQQTSIRNAGARAYRLPAVAWILALLVSPAGLPATEVTLRNGLALKGDYAQRIAITVRAAQQTTGTGQPLRVIDTGRVRYHFHRSMETSIDNSLELIKYEAFDLFQSKTGRKPIPDSIGSFFRKKPFNESGHSTVTLRAAGPGGVRNIDIVLGITKLTPHHLTVEGLTHVWKFAVSTTSVKPATLEKLLDLATDKTDPHDRLAVCRFYIDANMFRQATAELESVKRDFPELVQRYNTIRLDLRQALARQVLDELELRQRAGQHLLALDQARRFPTTELETEALNRVNRMIADYEAKIDQIDRVNALIGELQAQLDEEMRTDDLTAIRMEIAEQLDFITLDRMDAFLASVDDDTINPDIRLALGLSGWILGSVNAVDDLRLTVNLYRARHLILEYLRATDDSQRETLMSRLSAVEGIGPERVQQLIPLLPPVLETPGIGPGIPVRIDASPSDAETPVAYSALLPLEYTPNHRYPLIVSLHPVGGTPERQLLWWGGKQESRNARMLPGQAMRHGAIVIAPEYTDADANGYDYSSRAHRVVIAAIRDARKRFSIDSDRVFLSGHSSGGDAAFDIGLSHPEIFAGVIPISGRVDTKYCRTTARNRPGTAWYVVGGEYDRAAHEANALLLNRMMKERLNVVYAEYLGRGKETYYEEIHRLFEWMKHQTRTPLTEAREVKVNVLRPAEVRYFWIDAEGLPATILRANQPAVSRSSRPRTMSFEAEVSPGNTIRLRSGADRHTLWLSPELVNYERPLSVLKPGSRRDSFKGFVIPGIEPILEDLRIRGDRERLFTARIVID